jgi:cytidylate kinase
MRRISMKHFVITIARGYGSGGKTVGKMLAEELGIHYYDRELLRLASDDSGINEELFGRADEQLKQSLLYKIARKEYKGELIPPDKEDFISNNNLFNYQAKVIRDIAEEESCVIVGRCADYILKDNPNVIKIFVHASLEDCVIRLNDMFSLPLKELEKKVIATDKRRAEYYKYYTGRDWEDAKNYDLCLNSQQLGFDKCVKIVKSYIDIRLS